MARYIIEAPDGRRFEIEKPEQEEFTAPPPESFATRLGRGVEGFAFGSSDEALLGLPKSAMEQAGVEIPEYGWPEVAGRFAGFSVGGPGKAMVATGRALTRPIVRATAPIVRKGLRHLAIRILLGGAKGAAGLGATGVGPTLEGDVGAIPRRAATGLLLGAPLEGVAIPAVYETWRGIARMIGKAPTEEALATMSDKVLRRYPTKVRERGFDIKRRRIEEGFAPTEAELETQISGVPSRQAIARVETQAKTEQAISRIEQEGHQMAESLKQRAKQLDEALVNQQYQTAQQIQQGLPATMRNLSDRYGALRDSGLQKARGVSISEKELYQELSSELASDPRALNTASEIFRIGKRGPLGTKGKLPQVSRGEVRLKTGELTLEDLPPELRGQLLQSRELIRAEDLVNGIRAVRSNISRTRRAGEQMYDYADMVLDDISEAIMNIIKRRAPAEAVKYFEAASSLWREWAPIRNRAFKEGDPFVGQPIGLKPMMQSLKAAASSEDPTAVRFISELERFSEVPPGTFTGEIQKILASMSTNERAAAADRVAKALAQEQAKTTGSRALADVESRFGGEKEALLLRKQALTGEKAGKLSELAERRVKVGLEADRVRRIRNLVLYSILAYGSGYFRARLATVPLSSSER